MMYLETPPRLIETRIFSAMPDTFRRKGVRTDWAEANRPGIAGCNPPIVTTVIGSIQLDSFGYGDRGEQMFR